MGSLVATSVVMWMRMWLFHSMARMISKMDEPSLDQQLASLKCPTLSLLELKACYTMTNGGTRKHWGHVVTFLRFADRFPLSKQDCNVLYAEIVNHRDTGVPDLLPLTVMYLYFYVRFLCRS